MVILSKHSPCHSWYLILCFYPILFNIKTLWIFKRNLMSLKIFKFRWLFALSLGKRSLNNRTQIHLNSFIKKFFGWITVNKSRFHLRLSQIRPDSILDSIELSLTMKINHLEIYFWASQCVRISKRKSICLSKITRIEQWLLNCIKFLIFNNFSRTWWLHQIKIEKIIWLYWLQFDFII